MYSVAITRNVIKTAKQGRYNNVSTIIRRNSLKPVQATTTTTTTTTVQVVGRRVNEQKLLNNDGRILSSISTPWNEIDPLYSTGTVGQLSSNETRTVMNANSHVRQQLNTNINQYTFINENNNNNNNNNNYNNYNRSRQHIPNGSITTPNLNDTFVSSKLATNTVFDVSYSSSQQQQPLPLETSSIVSNDITYCHTPKLNSTKNKLSLLSGIDTINNSSTLIWKESINDYVFNILVPGTSSSSSTSTSTSRSYQLPMNYILRSIVRQHTKKNYVNCNNSQRDVYNSNFHQQPYHRQQRMSFHLTSQNSREETSSKTTIGQLKVPAATTTTTTKVAPGTPEATTTTTTTSAPTAETPPPPSKSTPETLSFSARFISRTIGTTQIPTPSSIQPIVTNPLESLKKVTPKNIIHKGIDMSVSVFKTIITYILKIPPSTYYYLTHPVERKDAIEYLWKTIKHEVHHYWVGTKLLWSEIQTAKSLLQKTLHGSSLTRRERRQLLRTVSDLFRLIPFSMFVIIPFMEFALPFALRIFPNLLPSTYQNSLKAEEDMKRELKSRIAMAQFFQETLEQLAKEQTQKASRKKKELAEAGIVDDESSYTIEKQEDSAGSMLEFLSKARRGEMIPPDVIIRYAKYFQDDLTLGNMPRMQLINMCRYMSIPPYGNDNLLRFQLRLKIRNLKEDDQRILWEGIESLTKMELREACQERGMRSTGLSKEAYKRNLQQWLDLSVNKDVPISLLIMSRTFFLQEEGTPEGTDAAAKNLTGLADAISGLDKEIVNEVILEVATTEEKKSDYEVQKIKLEVLSQQNELIKEEEKALKDEEAAKLKAESKAAAAAVVSAKETEAMESALESQVPVADPTASLSSSSSASSVTQQPSAGTAAVPDSEKVVEKEKKVEKEGTLSTEEMDAISQFISQDPVSIERADLEKIKAAMKVEDKVKKVTEDTVSAMDISDESKVLDSSPLPPVTPEEADKYVQERISEIDKAMAAMSADAGTTTSSGAPVPPGLELIVEEEEEEVEIDPVIARLKKRVESMVGKIEVQLTNAEEKIGDKLHFLDRDKDGILSREEMAHALQTTLKRELSFEQALQIADAMDENKDGVFTVAELSRWIDENKLVRFFEEGRDLEADQIIANAVSTNQTKKEENAANSSSSNSNSNNTDSSSTVSDIPK